MDDSHHPPPLSATHPACQPRRLTSPFPLPSQIRLHVRSLPVTRLEFDLSVPLVLSIIPGLSSSIPLVLPCLRLSLLSMPSRRYATIRSHPTPTPFSCALQTLLQKCSSLSLSHPPLSPVSEAPGPGSIFDQFFCPFFFPIFPRPVCQAMSCWTRPDQTRATPIVSIPPFRSPSTMSYPTNASLWDRDICLSAYAHVASIFFSSFPLIDRGPSAGQSEASLLVHLLQGSPPTGSFLLAPVGPSPPW